MQEAEELRLKEERKIVAGYASGRKALQVSLYIMSLFMRINSMYTC